MAQARWTTPMTAGIVISQRRAMRRKRLSLLKMHSAGMAFLTEPPVCRWFPDAAGIDLDLRGGSEDIRDEGAERVGVAGGIGNDVTRTLEAGQEGLGLRAVAVLPRRRMNADRQAHRIDRGMELRRQTTPGAADHGSLSLPFAPVASVCTCDMVPSIRTYSKSGVSAMAWNMPLPDTRV